MDSDVWTYYRGVIDEIAGPGKPAKPISEQQTEALTKISGDMANALQLLGRAQTIIRCILCELPPTGLAELLHDIDEFKESL